MTQKAKPGEKTLLELVSQGKIRTSEDIPELSESEFVQKWGLPLITGVEMETEDYDPGALDAAFASLGFVGGSLKTGYKIGKEVVKKAGQLYKRAIRPKVFPTKDSLLRSSEWLNEAERFNTTPITPISESIPQGYQPGTYARQAKEAIPSPGLSSFTPEQSIQHIIDSTEGQIRGGVRGGDLSWNQAKQIYDDIGREGFDEFKSEILSMPQDAREAAMDNFVAKYNLSAGTVSGQQASAVYKQTRFTSDMPDQVISTSRGSAKLEVKTYKTGENASTIRIEMEPLNPKSPYNKPSAYADFKISKVRTPDGQTFDRVNNIHFYGTAGQYLNDAGEIIYPGQKYAGLIMRELLNKVPPNTIVDESLLTYDSLYGLIKTAMKTDSKIIFNNPVLKRQGTQSSLPSQMSPITRKWVEMTESGIPNEEATDAVISELNEMIHKHMKKGLVEGVPDFKASSYGAEKGIIRFNVISVHKLGALVAGAFGFKNREEFMKFLEHDPESVESQVFDSDFSI